MSEIEALQARVAAAQAQLGQAHEYRHEQSARLAELIDSVEKTLAAKQSEIEDYNSRIQALEQKNEQLRGLLEGLLAVIEGTGTDRLSEAMQNLDSTFAALAGGAALIGAAAAAPSEPATAEAEAPTESEAEAILESENEAPAVEDEVVAEDAAAGEDLAEESADVDAPPEDLAELLNVDDGPAEDDGAEDCATDDAADELSADAVAELLGEPVEGAAPEDADTEDAAPEDADEPETVMGELHMDDPAEASAEPAEEGALAEEGMAEEPLAALDDASADDGLAVPDAASEPNDEADEESLSGDPTRVKEIIERVSRLADEMAEVINNGGGEAEGGPDDSSTQCTPEATETEMAESESGETDLGELDSAAAETTDADEIDLAEPPAASAAS